MWMLFWAWAIVTVVCSVAVVVLFHYAPLMDDDLQSSRSSQDYWNNDWEDH